MSSGSIAWDGVWKGRVARRAGLLPAPCKSHIKVKITYDVAQALLLSKTQALLIVVIDKRK